MERPFQVGITGGIGSGKSLVCRIFGVLGIPLYDADSRAKILMTTDRILVDQIKKEFGNLSYHPDGSLNREHLRKAFSNTSELNKLNAIVHPRVAMDYKKWVDQQIGFKYVIKEAALLLESGSAKELDHLIVVFAPKPLRIQRVLKRDPHRSQLEVENIINNQMDDKEKMALANDVIVNDETCLVIPQVLELHERLNLMN
ncbi:MAG TPA: dephospho-CoA kinase [Cytophagales bacterium]|nr:dephospho-CoA kinase [Cytophagales bacterium]HCR54354.1 dephospho-CoA kinase [Cytophagales bacterium]